MKTILPSVLVWVFAILTGSGEVIDAEGKGGAYFEVHLEKDGHHWFYIIPGDKPTGGSRATVDGLKNGKPVLVFQDITNQSEMSWVKDAEKVLPQWRAYSFAVRLDLVDELKMIQYQPPQGDLPGGVITTTNLLWLVEEAKRTGRFKDHSRKDDAAPNKKPDAGKAAPPVDGEKPSK